MPSTTVEKITHKLRARLLEMNEGDFLGFEDALIQDLGVSRPTFRQATRVLSHENLLTIKRGVGGGFYAARPDINTVGRAVSTYLRSRSTTLAQVAAADNGLIDQAISLAAQSNNKFAQGKLDSLRNRLQNVSTSAETPTELLEREIEFMDLVGELCGNPAIELCIHMFNQFGVDQSSDKVWMGRPKRIESWSAFRLRAIEAILAGDEQLASSIFRQRGELMSSWIGEDSK